MSLRKPTYFFGSLAYRVGTFQWTLPRARLLYSYRGTREPLDNERIAREFVLELRHNERVVLHKKLAEIVNQSEVSSTVCFSFMMNHSFTDRFPGKCT